MEKTQGFKLLDDRSHESPADLSSYDWTSSDLIHMYC